MNRSTDATLDEGFELSLETLDQWEIELDQFAATIMKRLAELRGVSTDSMGMKSQTSSLQSGDQLQSNPPDDSESMRLLKSLRELSQSTTTKSW